MENIFDDRVLIYAHIFGTGISRTKDRLLLISPLKFFVNKSSEAVADSPCLYSSLLSLLLVF